MIRINRNNPVDELAVSGFRGDWLRGIKRCALKKLAGRARDDEAVLVVIRPRFTTFMHPFAVRVEVIYPGQIIGEGEGVFLKFKRARADELLVARTAAQKENHEQCRMRNEE